MQKKSVSSYRECPECKNTVPEGKQFCPECLFNYGYWQATGRKYVEKQMPLATNSTYSKRFMFNDKAWEQDIKSRRRMPDGKIGRFKDGKRIG